MTEVTGYRLSVIHHTPQHLGLSSEDWDILRDTGFPVNAVWEQGMTNQDESDDESDLDHIPGPNFSQIGFEGGVWAEHDFF